MTPRDDTPADGPVRGWEGIETAPRDGMQVLVAGGTYMYDAECFPVDRAFQGVSIARWVPSEQSWEGAYGSEFDALYWHQPTHWMPLPPAPVQP
jgi:hypothetical protein